MVDVLYALHDFEAENQDELSFNVGEAIVVLERDDQYGDGWYQGRNLLGEVGLFPQSYTSTSPPTDSPILEEDDHLVLSSPSHNFGFPHHAPVMEATMSDVQLALDGFSNPHLAVDPSLPPSSSSIADPTVATNSLASSTLLVPLAKSSDSRSIASGKEDSDDEIGPPIAKQQSILSIGNNPRAMLAANAVANAEESAKREAEVAERRRQEDEEAYARSGGRLSLNPLEGVDMSDDSGDEDDHNRSSNVNELNRKDSSIGKIVEEEEGDSSLKGANNSLSVSTGVDRNERSIDSAKSFDDKLRRWSQDASRSGTPLYQPDLAPPIALAPFARFDDEEPSLGSISILDASHNSFSSPLLSSNTNANAKTNTMTHGSSNLESTPILARSTSSRSSATSKLPPIDWPRMSTSTPTSRDPPVLPVQFEQRRPSMASTPRHSLTGSLQTSVPSNGFRSSSFLDNSANSIPSSSTRESYFSASAPPPNPLLASIGGGRTSLTGGPYYDSPNQSGESFNQQLRSSTSSRQQQQQQYQQQDKPDLSVGTMNNSTTNRGSMSKGVVNGQLNGLPYDPREWGVVEVVAWGRAAGFDELTISKFQEHEISGDVLIEMDVAMLKEIDLAAFGKRVHIFNAIKQLKARIFSDPNSSAQTSFSGINLSGASPMTARPISRETSNGQFTYNSTDARYDDHRPGYFARERNTSISSSLLTSPPLTSSARSPGSTGSLGSLDTATEQRSVDDSGNRFVFKPSGARHGVNSKSVDSSRRPSSEGKLRASKSGNLTSPKKKSDRTFFGAAISTIARARKPPPRVMTASTSDLEARASSKPMVDRTARRSTRLFGSFGSLADRNSLILPTPSQRSFTAPASIAGASSEGRVPSRIAGPTMVSTLPDAATSEMKVAQTSQVMSGNLLEKIGKPDHSGWLMKKGEKYNSWKQRYFVLKGVHLYYLKSETEQKVKGFINLSGYRVLADPDIHVGEFAFKIVHETDRSHYFSAAEQSTARTWMKEMMKSTIGRDYSEIVVSTCNVDTIPLSEAQSMKPRPPSPSSRARVQRDRYNLDGQSASLTPEAAATLMAGLHLSPPGSPNSNDSYSNKARRTSLQAQPRASKLPQSPSLSSLLTSYTSEGSTSNSRRASAIASVPFIFLPWINANLPPSIPKVSSWNDLRSGRVLTRLVENLSGVASCIDDKDFEKFKPTTASEPLDSEYLDTCFSVFDELSAAKISTDDISINDILQGDPQKLSELLERMQQLYPGRSA